MSRGGEGNGTANFGKGDRIKASVLEEMFLRGRGGGSGGRGAEPRGGGERRKPKSSPETCPNKEIGRSE